MTRNPICRCGFLVVSGLAAAMLAGASRAGEPAAVQHSSPGKLDRAAVLRELQDVSLAGMDRRLGPDYASYHGQGPKEKFPEIWMPERKQGTKSRYWQVGGPWVRESGDYSSTQGQILYVPDKGGFGVDRVTIIEWSNGCFTESPEPPWWGGFRPEPASKKWNAAVKGDLGTPIAMARGMASWANNGVIVFSSGFVSAAGTCTGRGEEPTLQLPAQKLPTAIAVTNENEFAFITVYDTQLKKGQVAVLVLESTGKRNRFAHEWPDEYPGLPNVAIFSRIKLLGYIDLPGIEFPTAVTAVGNHVGGRVNAPDGNAGGLRPYNLDLQAHRDNFYKGDNAHYTSTAGFAVVVSKYNQKAAFIDLQPLFQRVREMYYTTEENFQKTRNVGLDPKQWPPAFDVDPSWKPAVVKVIDVPEPTAVIASMAGNEKARALIASLDGKVRLYTVGGLATEAPATAEDIQRVGEVQIGRNPTCLAYQKLLGDTIVAVSRGDREIAWIKYSPRGAEVIRRMKDARLLDPVNVEVADTHGIETPFLTVADFKGRKILNYRYGKVVFATQGGAVYGVGPDGKDQFECGGVLEFPGSPFCISATNVN